LSRYRILLLIWLLSDLILFVKAYAFAYFLRVGFVLSTDFPFQKFLYIVILVAPIWLLVLATTRTFALTRSQQTLRNGAYILYSALVGVALFSLAYYFTYEIFFSRLLLIYAFLMTAMGTWIWHILYSMIMRHLLRRNPPTFPTLILGVTRESTKLIEILNSQKNPLKPVAILDGKGSKEVEIDGVPVLGKLNKLEETLEKYKITHLIQCSDLEQTLNLLGACRKRSITYMLLPSVLGIVGRDERIETLEGQPVTMVEPKGAILGWFLR
jgi:FlaA1/EpsC-like NDP-sugar epimerase